MTEHVFYMKGTIKLLKLTAKTVFAQYLNLELYTFMLLSPIRFPW